ncbi:MAG: hypothetical protein DRK00_07980, partial [Thermoprotei archaeon]
MSSPLPALVEDERVERNVDREPPLVSSVERVFSQWGSLEASVLVSYGDELILGLYPAGLYAYDGSKWRLLYEPRDELFSAWSYDLFKGKLYVGAGTRSYGLVLEYDGDEVREALRVPDGTGGGGGLFEALTAVRGVLYAGRRNEVWATRDGVEWEKVFSFNTGKGVYLIGRQGDSIYVFEGEPIKPPTRVYSLKGSTAAEKVYHGIGAFRSHTPGSRSSYRGYLVIADFDGRVYFFKDFQLWEVYSFGSRYECRGNVAVRPKKVGDILLLAAGTGTGVLETHGELAANIGGEWVRLLTLPLNVHDVELYGENLYLACNSPARPLKEWFNTAYCCVLKLPA